MLRPRQTGTGCSARALLKAGSPDPASGSCGPPGEGTGPTRYCPTDEVPFWVFAFNARSGSVPLPPVAPLDVNEFQRPRDCEKGFQASSP